MKFLIKTKQNYFSKILSTYYVQDEPFQTYFIAVTALFIEKYSIKSL